MADMTLDEAIHHFAPLDPNTNFAPDLCKAAGGSLTDALNAVAIRVAELYMQGELDFNGADSIASRLFGYVTAVSDLQKMPEPMYAIFLAFDAGGYPRKEDSPDTEPADKYTKPMLREVFASRAAI